MVLKYLDEGHTTAQMRAMLSRSGGFVSHFGTSDASKIHALCWALTNGLLTCLS